MAEMEKKPVEKKPAEKKKKENRFSKDLTRAGKLFRDVKNEIKKIVWPTPKSVFKNTGIVLVAIIISGLFISGLDSLFLALLGLVMNV